MRRTSRAPAKTFPNERQLLLAIDDDPAAVELVEETLAGLPVRLISASNAESGLQLFRTARPRLVLLDFHLPDQTGLDTLARLLNLDPAADVILVTGEYSTDIAVEAIRRGALDYITKPFKIAAFRSRIESWLSARSRQLRVSGLYSELLDAHIWHGMIGSAPAMIELFSRIERIAPHYRTALVTGETGTGKELVARAIHSHSPVAAGPYIPCNCAAFADSLFESEVFGYVRGAFTGATQDRPGLIAAAHGGTLFLDEVGELPLSAQAKLLRVLQTREVRPVGSTRATAVDIRVIAATNRDLSAMVAARAFREDLYYRLAMLGLHLPPLRERKEDIPLLARHFVNTFAEQYGKPDLQILPRALAALTRYSWPGNIRQLENVLGAATLMADHDLVDVRHLPPEVCDSRPETPSTALPTLAEATLQHVRFVLRELNGNRRQAARTLGISRAKLYRILGEAEPAIAPASESEDSTAYSTPWRATG